MMESSLPRPPRSSQPSLNAMHAAGGDELVAEMLKAYLGFATAQLHWLARQLATRQYEAFSDAARALRISSAQVGATEVASACELAELAGAGHDPAAAAHALEQVEAAFGAAEAWMRGLSAS